MPIRKFDIQNLKALQRAACDSVPQIMVIAGANGVGKSTLLHAIKQRYGNCEGSGKILYMGPHRAWRKQSVRAMHLFQRDIIYRDLLSSDSVGHVDGMSLYNAPRTPDSLDEAHSLIKYTLAQIEIRRQSAIASLYDKGVGNMQRVDVYRPLRNLVNTLLPHLQFERVSSDNKDNVQCLFRRVDSPSAPRIDIDDLSSGEKAVIALFLPFLEDEIDALVRDLSGKERLEEQDLICVMDEPELHLHPLLQSKLLDYFRQTVVGHTVQFIVSTHSPVLINSAALDELFILMPPQGTPSYNQLIPATSEVTRLEALRVLVGDTFSATSGRPLVLVEGENPADIKDEPSDVRIIELLSPGFKRFSLVPMGGKDRIGKLGEVLQQVMQPGGSGLTVFAITDMDRRPVDSDATDRLFAWPVTMIENFLLEPTAIMEVLEPYREKTGLFSASQIADVLNTLALDLRDDEVRLRLGSKYEPFRWYFNGATAEAILDNVEKAKRQLESIIGDRSTVEANIQEVQRDVDAIIARGTALAQFHGKHILREFHRRYVQPAQFRYKSFCIETARTIGRNGEPAGLRDIRLRIEAYVPAMLRSLLADLVRTLETRPTAHSVAPFLSTLDDAIRDRNKGDFGSLVHTKHSLLETLHALSVDLCGDASGEGRLLCEKVRQAYQLALTIRTPQA